MLYEGFVFKITHHFVDLVIFVLLEGQEFPQLLDFWATVKHAVGQFLLKELLLKLNG